MDLEGVQDEQRDIHQTINDHREEDAQAHARNFQEHRDTRTQMSESGMY
jgi:hypothetical protein